MRLRKINAFDKIEWQIPLFLLSFTLSIYQKAAESYEVITSPAKEGKKNF